MMIEIFPKKKIDLAELKTSTTKLVLNKKITSHRTKAQNSSSNRIVGQAQLANIKSIEGSPKTSLFSKPKAKSKLNLSL